jgi:predicted Zn-dependent protease
MIMKKLEELEERKQKCQTELEELHLAEPSEYWYKLRRSDLELHICQLEEAIEAEKEVLREKTAADNAFIIVLYAIVVTGLGILIFM